MDMKYTLLQNMKYVLNGVWKYNKKIIWILIINTFLLSISPLTYLLFPRYIINELMNSNRSTVLTVLLFGFLLSTTIAGFLGNYLKGSFSLHTLTISTPFVSNIYTKCFHSDFQCTENPAFLNDVQTVTRDVNVMNFDRGINGLLHKFFILPGSFIALSSYIFIITKVNIFIFLFLSCNILINYLAVFSQKKFENSKQDELSHHERQSNYIYSIMYDFSYGKEIRLYDISDWIGSLFMKYRSKKRSVLQKIRSRNFLMQGIKIFLTFLRDALVYLYLLYSVLYNGMSIADFTMYLAAIAGLTGAFDTVMNGIADVNGLSMQISRYRNFIHWPNEMETARNPVPLPKEPYAFTFHQVSFQYPNSSIKIFENLNLVIPAGQKLAIVGHNGAGKSTFVKLLLRLYDATEGEILCNGINIKQFDRNAYYQLFSVVFQELLPLAFSAGDNISIGNGQKNAERIDACLKQVGLDVKINALKYGADTCVQKFIDDEGIEFSGGEKQKLLIARALYKNGAVMVLDEPTSALDAIAESEIYEKFNAMTEHKTSIFISHRLASTRFCDAIAFFENGKVTEYGTHDELLALNNGYAEMFQIQSQYYKEEAHVEESF